MLFPDRLKTRIPGQSGKYHRLFGGASCKPDFCVRFCSDHDLHVGAVYANLWEADALHKQIMKRTKDIAKVAFT